MSGDASRRMIDLALPPGEARRAALTLELHAGPAVGEAIGAVFMAKSARLIQAQKHGGIDDPGGAEGRRRRALEAIERVIEASTAKLYHHGDAALRAALRDVLPLLRAAARQTSQKRSTGRPTLGAGRARYVQRLRDLGATDRQAERIVSAIVGIRAQNIPDSPDPSDD
jgi:hypothetical protein